MLERFQGSRPAVNWASRVPPYSPELPLYCDESPEAFTHLRVSFREGANTTLEAYAYEAEFVVVSFNLPFQCINRCIFGKTGRLVF